MTDFRTFTLDDARKLNDARTVLKGLATRASRGAYPYVPGLMDGAIWAMAEAAENAVFQVLNWVSATSEWPTLSDDVVHNREDRAVVRLVFDTESEPPRFVGEYVGTDEDAVTYVNGAGNRRRAPQDCVTVVAVTLP